MEDRVQIFADGACRGNGKAENVGGYGILLKYKDNKKEIKHAEYNTTNNRQEILSVITALKTIKKKANMGIDVYSDSAYVINAINQNWIKKWQKNGWKTAQKKNVENKDLWLELIEQMDRFGNLVFHKVKGHTNSDSGNDIADKLANEAMDELIKDS